MKLPIIVNEHGSCDVFATVEEAEAYMEPIDVENGEYTVTDANGQNLIVYVIIKEVPLLWGLFKTRVKKTRIIDPAEL